MEESKIKNHVMENYKCYSVGYKRLDGLFWDIEPDYIDETLLGWNADIYCFGKIAIVTGGFPYGEILDKRIVEHFNEAAHEIIMDTRLNANQIAKELQNLRRDFIRTIADSEI